MTFTALMNTLAMDIQPLAYMCVVLNNTNENITDPEHITLISTGHDGQSFAALHCVGSTVNAAAFNLSAEDNDLISWANEAIRQFPQLRNYCVRDSAQRLANRSWSIWHDQI